MNPEQFIFTITFLLTHYSADFSCGEIGVPGKVTDFCQWSILITQVSNVGIKVMIS